MSTICLLTRSGSEFLIHEDGRIDRMSLVSTRFSEFAPAGTTIDVLVEGLRCTGHDPDGHPFTTNVVDRMVWIDP